MQHETQNGLRTQVHEGVTWVDVENPSAEALAELEKTYALHPAHVKECIQKVQHVQVEREQGYLFLVLHVPVLMVHRDKIHLSQVGVFLGKNFMITIRSGASPCITDLFEVSNLSPDKAKEYFENSTYLLYRLVASLLNDISEMTDDINNELDEIEDLVFDNRDSDALIIGKLRQKIVRLGRVIGPKRLVLQDLEDQIDSFSGKNVSKYYANNTKLVNKLWEEIEEAKETVEVYKDADFTTSTEQTNLTLAVLTLVFTFTIPITVFASMYGMNILLPGSVNGKPWHFWGQYTTLIIVVIISCAAALGMYLYFRKKKWL